MAIVQHLKIGGKELQVKSAELDKNGNDITATYALKATTLSGYGITNAYTKTEIDTALNLKADKSTTYTETETNNLLDAKQNTITGAASSIVTNNLTASKALVSGIDGKVAASIITSTELGYLGGVVSNIQGQLGGKQATLSTAQLNAVNSGITSTKVATYDDYATSKQNTLSTIQQSAVDSGITSALVTQITTNQNNITSLTNGKLNIKTTTGKYFYSHEGSTQGETQITFSTSDPSGGNNGDI